MKRFKNILLAAGGKDWETTVLPKAEQLARHNQARLTVIDVIKELPQELIVQDEMLHVSALQKVVVTERRSQLERLLEPLERRDGRVSAKVLVGRPFLEIIRQVMQYKHDLVMTASHGTGELKRMLFGSTSMHLMRKCPCPLWVVKPTSRKTYARILAAVDPDPSDSEQRALTGKIMELATSLARMEGGAFHAVHAWHLDVERMLTVRGGISPEAADTLARSVRGMHAGWLGRLVDAYAPDTPASSVHLLKGDPGSTIPALVKREGIDILVMGTLSRSGIAGYLIGNTAEKILHQVDCSVMTVKPDGFMTPVKLG